MPITRARRIFIVLAIAAGALLAGAVLVIRDRFGGSHIRSEILKHFAGTVDARSFRVHYLPRPGCTIEGLTMRTKFDTPDAPFGYADKVDIEGSYLSLIGGSKRVRIGIDHGRIRLASVHDLADDFQGPGGEKTVVEQVRGSDLVVDVGRSGKQPVRFEFRRLTAGPIAAGETTEGEIDMIDPLPRGELRIRAKIGPWRRPFKDTPVTGSFDFERADLGVFPALSGSLSSSGTLLGTLARIGVKGDAQVSDFEVRANGHSVHLSSKYRAEVNGQNGDVELSWVETDWGQTRLVTIGKIAGSPGKQGKVADLRLSVDRGRIEDLMELVMHASPTLRGRAAFQGKAVWPPGRAPFIQRIEFTADFKIDGARFTRTRVQAGVNKLSERALGEKDLKLDEVLANLRGHVELRSGIAHFTKTSLTVPGAAANLAGRVNLVNERLDIGGQLRMQASLSQATTGVKSLFLKPIDPFFRRKHESSGADLPVQMTGTIDAPRVGLDLNRKISHRSGAE
jgi:hypothetical protein